MIWVAREQQLIYTYTRETVYKMDMQLAVTLGTQQGYLISAPIKCNHFGARSTITVALVEL
jgi:hypothetical protein